MKEKRRCPWAMASPRMMHYHDTKWGREEHRDSELYAMLILEGAQAGLSWATILEKEENYREIFEGLDPAKVAEYGPEKEDEILSCTGIIRNRRKIHSAVVNARAFLQVQKEFGTFDRYIWGFTEGKVIDHRLERTEDMPPASDLSERISRDLKKRGFTFVGPVIVYSYLQSIGIINDHLLSCEFRNGPAERSETSLQAQTAQELH